MQLHSINLVGNKIHRYVMIYPVNLTNTFLSKTSTIVRATLAKMEEAVKMILIAISADVFRDFKEEIVK